MGAKFTRLTHKIAIQLHLVAQSYTISSSRSRRPVRKLLDTPSYTASAFTDCYLAMWQLINPPVWSRTQYWPLP